MVVKVNSRAGKISPAVKSQITFLRPLNDSRSCINSYRRRLCINTDEVVLLLLAIK